MHALDRRKQVIEKIRQSFVEADLLCREIDKKKFIAQVCLETGFCDRKIKEYLKMLLVTGFLKEENGIISLNEHGA